MKHPLKTTDFYIHTNGINLHYIEHDGGADKPLLIMMHGLTANAHAFDGLAAAELADDFRMVSVDLRGRGLSDHPALHYSAEDHANDILGLLDHLAAEHVILCGHSFGGLLGMYLAANHPKRVSKLIILDAAARMNPHAAEMLGYRLSTLDKVYPSWEAYITDVKAAPYNTFWDDAMLPYYEADVRQLANGSVTPRSNLAEIIQASMGLANISWPFEAERIKAPTLLVNAPGDYTMEQPLLPEDYARETVALLQHGTYVSVPGNHQTMLYGKGAMATVAAIRAFMLSTSR